MQSRQHGRCRDSFDLATSLLARDIDKMIVEQAAEPLPSMRGSHAEQVDITYRCCLREEAKQVGYHAPVFLYHKGCIAELIEEDRMVEGQRRVSSPELRNLNENLVEICFGAVNNLHQSLALPKPLRKAPIQPGPCT